MNKLGKTPGKNITSDQTTKMTARDFDIRQARPEDGPGIAAVVNPVIRDTAVTFTTLEKDPDEFRAAITAAPNRYIVAEVDGEVIGYATFFQFRGGPGYAHTMEHSIALAPEAWGGGVGRALMAALEQAARADGAHTLFAGVSGENPAGVKFHAALGFEEVCTLKQVGHKFGRWMDLVLMQKFL